MGSRLWYQRVLKPNCALLARLNQQPWPRQAALLDAGCGEGLAFKLLEQYFKPRIIFWFGYRQGSYSQCHCPRGQAQNAYPCHAGRCEPGVV